jgi:hypothetical protein
MSDPLVGLRMRRSTAANVVFAADCLDPLVISLLVVKCRASATAWHTLVPCGSRLL